MVFWSSFCSVSSNSISQDTPKVIARKRYAASTVGKGSIPVSRLQLWQSEDPDVLIAADIICMGGMRQT